jgi:hypothetical protein
LPPRRATASEATIAARKAALAKQDHRTDTATDEARRKRTQEFLARERAREAVLKAQGYCF